MGDLARASSSGLDELPIAQRVTTAIRVHHSVDIGQVEAPHGGNRAFLQIATSMNVETKNSERKCKDQHNMQDSKRANRSIYILFFVTDGDDERGVVGTALGQLALKSHFNPVIAL